jgi:hypothetical protein
MAAQDINNQIKMIKDRLFECGGISAIYMYEEIRAFEYGTRINEIRNEWGCTCRNSGHERNPLCNAELHIVNISKGQFRLLDERDKMTISEYIAKFTPVNPVEQIGLL